LKDFVRRSFELCGTKIRTEVHDPSHNDVTMWNPMDYTKVMAGTALHDFAEVEIIVPGVKMDPLGQVEFRLFKDLNCTNPALDEYDEPLVWTFEVVPGTDPMGNGTLDDYLGWAETPSMVLPAAKDYSFSAKFLSDLPQYFPHVTATCEPFSIAKYPTAITTQIHAGTDHVTNLDGNPDGVPLGTTLHDHAYVSTDGSEPFQATVTFYLWKNPTCGDGEEWNVNEQDFLNDFEGEFGVSNLTEKWNWPVTVNVMADGTYVTPDFTPLAGEQGPFSIKAKFNGDLNYLPSDPSACEVLTANQLKAKVVTEVKVRDLAKVTDMDDNPITDGKVLFWAYDSADCTGNLVDDTEPSKYPIEVDLDAFGVAEEAKATANEITLHLDPNHAVYFKAIYDGGTGLYEQTEAICEKVVFERKYP
jgi:hypothetical protein